MTNFTIEGDSPENISIDWDTPRFGTKEIGPTDELPDESLKVVLTFKGGVVEAGRVIYQLYHDEVNIFDFKVQPRFRRQGVGTHMMDITKGIVLWRNADRLSGGVVGGESTKQFFVDNGIPEESITIDESQDIAGFAEDVENIKIDQSKYNIVD